MKTLLLALFMATTAFGHYSKPQLLARYTGNDSYNAPDGLTCFDSSPAVGSQGVYLGCVNDAGESQMMRFADTYQVLARSEIGLFSLPIEMGEKFTWYEFTEAGINHLFESSADNFRIMPLKNLGPFSSIIDSFLPITNQVYIYRLQSETKSLQLWTATGTQTLFNESNAHLFPPVTDATGHFIFKIRREQLNDSAPDELMYWDGGFKVILKDRDSDPNSKLKSFRHQYAVDNQEVAIIGTDDDGEAIFILEKNKLIEVARVGRDLMNFDYFAPKLRNGTLVFRGLDLEKRRAFWVYDHEGLRKLVTEGDIVQTDKGPARIYYKSQDALFYGSAGIGANGDIALQATLTDMDYPETLLGVGLLTFKKE